MSLALVWGRPAVHSSYLRLSRFTWRLGTEILRWESLACARLRCLRMTINSCRSLILVRETISLGKFGALHLGEGEQYSADFGESRELGRGEGLVPCGASVEFVAFVARLKPCPSKTLALGVCSASSEACAYEFCCFLPGMGKWGGRRLGCRKLVNREKLLESVYVYAGWANINFKIWRVYLFHVI
jgi:hypothetical protein